jgi:hypothetical protein
VLVDEPAWAPWALDTETYELVQLSGEDPEGDYRVDLERCLTPAGVLDWVLQIDDRADRRDQVTLGLLRAVTDLLRPQETLCSFGQATAINAPRMRELVNDYLRQSPPVGRNR